MPGTKTGTPAAHCAPWFLSRLKRSRPLALSTVIETLRYYERLVAAIQLLEGFFPGETSPFTQMSRVRTHFSLDAAAYQQAEIVGWWQVLAHFFNRVEQADWFQLNWQVINEASACWAAPEYQDSGEMLASYLTYIPLKMYGFTRRETLADTPPIELMHALLADNSDIVSARLLTEAELYDAFDEWDAVDRAAAWRFLKRIESDPLLWPEPARKLPELARWACHQTENPLLDQHFDPYNLGPWHTWHTEAHQLTSCWVRARPVIDAFQCLMTWYEHDPGRLASLAHFIITGAELERQLTDRQISEDDLISSVLKGDMLYEFDW